MILTAVTVLAGCNRKAKNPPPAPTEITSDTMVQLPSHSAKNLLDYIGIYKGKLPYNQQEAETVIELSEGFSYSLSRKSGAKNHKLIEIKGRYSWNEAGNAIILENLKGELNQYFVGENSLTQIDASGNKIEGNVLRKMSEAEAVVTDGRPSQTAVSINGTRWRLFELNGKPVTNKGEKEFITEFKSDGTMTAYAGCNSIGGKYKISEHTIEIANIISTRMACDGMDVETKFLATLESADNFVSNQKVLQLRKGGINLAKFEAVVQK